MAERIAISPATTPAEYETGRRLFTEYAAALGVDLCFQSFDDELARIAEMYGPPGGRLLLATQMEAVLGCVGVRRLADDTCEMKRLYVRDAARGLGLGRQLASRAIDAGRQLGYRHMVLDTLPSMVAAHRLYASLGFTSTVPYYRNPLPGVRYLALDLSAAALP